MKPYVVMAYRSPASSFGTAVPVKSNGKVRRYAKLAEADREAKRLNKMAHSPNVYYAAGEDGEE